MHLRCVAGRILAGQHLTRILLPCPMCPPDVTGAVAWLCRHGADVAALKHDDWRDTALHYAAASGCLEACNSLLVHGADASATNFAGTMMA